MAHGTFDLPVGKVRYSGNRRYIVAGRRPDSHATKDGQTAQVLKRSDSAQTALEFARRASYGPGTVCVFDTTRRAMI